MKVNVMDLNKTSSELYDDNGDTHDNNPQEPIKLEKDYR